MFCVDVQIMVSGDAGLLVKGRPMGKKGGKWLVLAIVAMDMIADVMSHAKLDNLTKRIIGDVIACVTAILALAEAVAKRPVLSMGVAIGGAAIYYITCLVIAETVGVDA